MTTRRQRGFTLIELLIVVAIIGIIAAIAIPSLMRARQSANEASAIGSLRSVASSQQNFAASAARGGYAPTLPRLGATCPGSTIPFLSSELTTGISVDKSGFTMEMRSGAGAVAGPTDCNALPTTTGFYLFAVASAPGLSANRAFAVTNAGSIWENVTAPGSIAPLETEMDGAATTAVHPLR